MSDLPWTYGDFCELFDDYSEDSDWLGLRDRLWSDLERSSSSVEGTHRGELPPDLASMHKLVGDLVGGVCSTWINAGIVEVNGPGGGLQLWLDDGQWWNSVGRPGTGGLAAVVAGEQRLAYLLSWTAGIAEEVLGRGDLMGYATA